MEKLKGLLLLSSGIDSPVAGYLMSKKGVTFDAIYFDNKSDSDQSRLNKVKKNVQNLAKLVDNPITLHIVNHEFYQEIYKEKCNPRLQCIFCKRTMVKVAEKIAKDNNCHFLIKGDNLGQVASQTLENLEVVDSAISIPIQRPIIGLDKNETIVIAKKIGTYDTSIEKEDSCPFLPSSPKTTSTKNHLEYEENKIDINNIINKDLSEHIETITFKN